MFASDDWTIAERVLLSIRRTLRLARLSERHRSVEPARRADDFAGAHTRIRAAVSQRRLAPGAEEFLPPMPGHVVAA